MSCPHYEKLELCRVCRNNPCFRAGSKLPNECPHGLPLADVQVKCMPIPSRPDEAEVARRLSICKYCPEKNGQMPDAQCMACTRCGGKKIANLILSYYAKV